MIESNFRIGDKAVYPAHGVAEVTGIPKATLYYYFTGKEEILVFLLRDLLNGVADPNFSQVAAPRSARSRPASQREIAPTLLSHLAMAIPRKFRYVARASPESANAMKYPEEALACALAREETYSALPAAKYRRPGKKGRLLVQ